MTCVDVDTEVMISTQAKRGALRGQRIPRGLSAAPSLSTASIKSMLAEIDARCRKCGECCREKIMHKGQMVAMDSFCPALDPETRLCRIYWNRELLLPALTRHRCTSIFTAIRSGCAPPGCAYVKPGDRTIEYSEFKYQSLPWLTRAVFKVKQWYWRRTIDKYLNGG